MKNLALIISKDNTELPTRLLLGDSPEGNNGKASELKSKMELLKNNLLDYCKNDTTAAVIIKESLSTNTTIITNESGIKVGWELDNFYHVAAISAINKLSSFQRNARIAEIEVLASLEPCTIADVQKPLIKNK